MKDFSFENMHLLTDREWRIDNRDERVVQRFSKGSSYQQYCACHTEVGEGSLHNKCKECRQRERELGTFFNAKIHGKKTAQ